MTTIKEKIPTRQQLLRAWLLERGLTLAEAARAMGMSKQQACYLVARPSIRPSKLQRFLDFGIPAELLPPESRPKAELLAEVQELRARLGENGPDIQPAE